MATSRSRARRSSTGRKRSTRSKRSSGKRELIAPRGDKRYVRRTGAGRFSESDDVGRSRSTDRRRRAKTRSKRGQGDRGDRKPGRG